MEQSVTINALNCSKVLKYGLSPGSDFIYESAEMAVAVTVELYYFSLNPLVTRKFFPPVIVYLWRS